MNEGPDSRSSFLARHWPLAVSVLALIVVCLVYVSVYTVTPSSAGISLVLAVLPNLIASLAIAACLYLLLNRDIRGSNAPGSGDVPVSLRQDIERITAGISTLTERRNTFRRRESLPPLTEFFEDGLVISIAAVSGLGLVNHFRGLLEEQLRAGRQLRVLLFDLEKRDALDTWDRLTNPPMVSPVDDIRSAVRQFSAMTMLPGLSGQCEVRLLDTILPFSLIMCQKRHRGMIQLELHAYRRAPEDRPNIMLSSEVDTHWYEFYSRQFDEAWRNSKPVR
jgi:hypothetical protein